MKKIIPIILLFTIFISTRVMAEKIKCKAAILMEADSGKILYEYNKDTVLPQASITKLMTYFVFKDLMKSHNISSSTSIKVDLKANEVPYYWSQAGLKYGQEVSLNQLLESLLIVSAGDSALELENFYNLYGNNIVDAMNEKTKEIGMHSTNYINVTGISENSREGLFNHSTVYDTALLSSELIKTYPEILKITSMKSFTYNGRNEKNTNGILMINKRADGLKTGYTSDAGYCLVSTEDITDTNGNGKPFRLLAVVFGCKSQKDRMDESIKLLKYGEDNFENYKIFNKTKIYSEKNEYYIGNFIEATSDIDEFLIKNRSDKLSEEVKFDKQLPLYIKSGDKVGIIQVTNLNTNEVIISDLFSSKNFKSVSIFKRIWLYIINMFNKVR